MKHIRMREWLEREETREAGTAQPEPKREPKPEPSKGKGRGRPAGEARWSRFTKATVLGRMRYLVEVEGRNVTEAAAWMANNWWDGKAKDGRARFWGDVKKIPESWREAAKDQNADVAHGYEQKNREEWRAQQFRKRYSEIKKECKRDPELAADVERWLGWERYRADHPGADPVELYAEYLRTL